MNKAQHTPGPWIADDNEGFSPWTIWSRMTPTGSGQAGPKVAQIVGDSDEADANARLIATAPELLAELQLVYERSYNPFEPDNQSEQYKRVGALIAKATGATP